MITGFFLNILYAVLWFPISLLPVTTFPPQITAGVATIWGYVNAYSLLFPVSTLVQVIAIATTFHIALFTWRMGNLIASYIRGR
jgi:hypothetical protein